MSERRGWPRRGGWEVFDTGWCTTCGRLGDRDSDLLCRDCAFVAKAKTLTFLAEPWALREVRRQYGVSGETNRASEYAKARREEEPETPMFTFGEED